MHAATSDLVYGLTPTGGRPFIDLTSEQYRNLTWNAVWHLQGGKISFMWPSAWLTFKDSKDFIQESTISYIHQEYVVCYD